MLYGYVRKELRQMAALDKRVTALRMGTDKIRGKFGRKLIVYVVSPFLLVFGEMFGVNQLPDVVLERRRTRVVGSLTDCKRARFRKLRNHNRMVVRTGRFFLQAL